MKQFILFIFFGLASYFSKAQNWLTTGNSGLTNSNYLGTTDAHDLIFKVKNIERGRLLQASGKWRFGSSANNAVIDSTGKLTFYGNGAYSVGNNKYIFRYSGDAVKGFYLSSTQDQYQFLNADGTPVFYINGDNGNSGVAGTFKIGAYTLPASDGNKNQVLKTDGAGNLIWKPDNGTAYTAGTGISISGDTINSTIAATQWTTNGKKIYYNDGNVGLGLPSPAYRLDVKGDINLRAGFIMRIAGNPFLNLDTTTNNVWFAAGYTSNPSGTNNTAIGRNALYNNLSGFTNVAIGNSALYHNLSSIRNVAIGDSALFNQTNNGGNVAIGWSTLYNNDSGLANTAVGLSCMYSNISGNNNTAIGASALQSNETGIYNTASGYYALGGNTSGNYNTAFGGIALGGLATGDYNSAFGYQAGILNGYSNSTALGHGASVAASNEVRIGADNVTSIGGAVDWSSPSDGRIKKNIKQNVPGLLFINKLQPVTYNFDLDAADKIIQRPPIKDKDGKIIQPLQSQIEARKEKQQIVYTGFIAQDVEKAAKSLNYDFSGVDAAKNDHDLYGLRYAEFVVPLVKAVQELSQQNDSLKNELTELKALILSQKNSINNGKQLTSNAQSAILSSTSLEQNIPNPFSNSTTINYTLPQQYSSAKIIITDKNGNALKQINLSDKGKGSVLVDASTLSSGAYQYSLIVNSKMIDSKQMVLTK